MSPAMTLPKIGDTVTTADALALCQHYHLNYLVDRININPNQYHSWKFDGLSGLPDQLTGFLTGLDWEDLTYLCALPHDLAYAYGELGDENERKQADKKFKSDLIEKAGMKKFLAKLFYHAVRIGGKEELGLSFSWGFANNNS